MTEARQARLQSLIFRVPVWRSIILLVLLQPFFIVGNVDPFILWYSVWWRYRSWLTRVRKRDVRGIYYIFTSLLSSLLPIITLCSKTSVPKRRERYLELHSIVWSITCQSCTVLSHSSLWQQNLKKECSTKLGKQKTNWFWTKIVVLAFNINSHFHICPNANFLTNNLINIPTYIKSLDFAETMESCQTDRQKILWFPLSSDHKWEPHKS